MNEQLEEEPTDYIWRCGQLWAHTKMVRADHDFVIQTPEGQRLLVEQAESLMGPADHQHIFQFNLGSLSQATTVYYDCVYKILTDVPPVKETLPYIELMALSKHVSDHEWNIVQQSNAYSKMQVDK